MTAEEKLRQLLELPADWDRVSDVDLVSCQLSADLIRCFVFGENVVTQWWAISFVCASPVSGFDPFWLYTVDRCTSLLQLLHSYADY